LENVDIPSADFEHAQRTLERLHLAVHHEPYISYYREEGEDLARAVETFIRINNGGMVIGYADLLFSILSAQWTQRNAREEIEKTETILRGYRTGLNLEKGFILKAALVMTEGHNLRFELSQFTSQRVLTMERIWDNVTAALEAAARTVQESGVLFLSAPSLVTILAYFHYCRLEQGQDVSGTPVDQSRIKQWLIRTQLFWSSERTATETKISRLIATISNHFKKGNTDFPFAALVAESWGVDMRVVEKGAEQGLVLETLLARAKWDGTTKFLLGLLHTNALGHVAYDVDHCFPFHEAYNAAYDEQHHTEINALPNLQLLPSSLNKSKSGRAFQEWYNELPVLLEDDAVRQDLNVETREALHAAHYYPSDWLAYDEQDDHEARVAKFRQFFEARKQTTLHRMREVFYEPS